MINDKIFLSWNCQDCTTLKRYISESMFEDRPGKNDQILVVIHTFSNNGTKCILNDFNLFEKKTPILLKYDGNVIEGVEKIISYLKENGFSKE